MATGGFLNHHLSAEVLSTTPRVVIFKTDTHVAISDHSIHLIALSHDIMSDTSPPSQSSPPSATESSSGESATVETPPKPGLTRPLIAGAIVLIGIAVVLVLGPSQVGEQLLHMWSDDAGPESILVFALCYIAATPFFIPAMMLAIGAGFLFGSVWGTVLVLSCRPLGALLSFLISRYIAHDHVQRWIADWQSFTTVDRLASEQPLKVVLVMRLFPILPFNLANYVFGLTRVDWKRYVLATALGVAPGSIFYVYLGVIAGDLTQALTLEDAPISTPMLLFWGTGTLIFFVALYLIIKVARTKWQEMVDEASAAEST